MARPTVYSAGAGYIQPHSEWESCRHDGPGVLVEPNNLQGISLHTFSQDPTIEELEKSGWLVQRNSEPHTLLDDCFYVSGAIPRQTDFENGQPGHMR